VRSSQCKPMVLQSVSCLLSSTDVKGIETRVWYRFKHYIISLLMVSSDVRLHVIKFLGCIEIVSD